MECMGLHGPLIKGECTCKQRACGRMSAWPARVHGLHGATWAHHSGQAPERKKHRELRHHMPGVGVTQPAVVPVGQIRQHNTQFYYRARPGVAATSKKKCPDHPRAEHVGH